jgi:hypothetical protein
MNGSDLRHAIIRIQDEYVEMPALKLTLGQVGRLWALPEDVSQAALAALVASGFLFQMRDGTYRRVGTAPVHVEFLDALTWAVGR